MLTLAMTLAVEATAAKIRRHRRRGLRSERMSSASSSSAATGDLLDALAASIAGERVIELGAACEQATVRERLIDRREHRCEPREGSCGRGCAAQC